MMRSVIGSALFVKLELLGPRRQTRVNLFGCGLF
jgi:hypothetical protein